MHQRPPSIHYSLFWEGTDGVPQQELKQKLNSKNNTEFKALVLQIGAGLAKH